MFSRVGVFAFLLASAEIMYTSHRLCVIYLLTSYICVFSSCCVRVDFVWYGLLPSKFTYCPRIEHEVEFSQSVWLRALCETSFIIESNLVHYRHSPGAKQVSHREKFKLLLLIHSPITGERAYDKN